MNENLSNIYLNLFKVTNIFALTVICLFWFGELNYYPSKIIMEFLNPGSIGEESKSIFPLLTKLLDWIISSLMYMLPFIVIGLGFGFKKLHKIL